MTTDNSTSVPVHVCPLSRRKWYIFLSSSLITFFGGLLIVLLARFLSYVVKVLRKRRRQTRDARKAEKLDTSLLKNIAQSSSDSSEWITEVKDWANELISAQSITGRILVVLVFFLSIASLGLYIYEATIWPGTVENCTPWSKNILNQIDLAFNVVFLVYFWIRFVAAQDKLTFWVELYTIVDFCTVPPSFVNIYLNQSWLGLRFMRALRIMTLPDVLQYLGILKSGTTIRFFQLITIFSSIWLSGSGAYHLLEASGDPYRNFSNAQLLTFGECMYYSMVTMSTVGYGDIAPQTDIGKGFVIIYILFTLSIFATFLPEIAEIITSQSQYSGRYKKEHGKRHIVVCGAINYESAESFLTDFLHKDREDTDVDVVFIHKTSPDLELQSLLKRNFGQVAYFEGTVMVAADCKRVCMESATSVIVLANKYATEPDSEDASNIMRVISIKNYSAKTRCIIQVLQYHNKGYLANIPNWDWRIGDEVVCIAELKLGFLAQSCLAPGFSTLMANLFSTRSMNDNQNSLAWERDYQNGSAMEIYSEFFSDSFIGFTFNEAVQLCFTKLKIILFAVESQNELGEKYLSINPGDKVSVYKTCHGFFIADSQEEVRRVYYYCNSCHRDVTDPRNIRKCPCKKNSTPPTPLDDDPNLRLRGNSANIHRPEISLLSMTTTDGKNFKQKKGRDKLPKIGKAAESSGSFEREELRRSFVEQELRNIGNKDNLQAEYFDLTGMFHWCPERHFEDILLSATNPNKHLLKGHYIVCVFANHDSPLLGLRSFVMPLRASNFHREELKPIVLIGNEDYLRREWSSIKTFPNIYIFPGSPINRVTLRNAQLSQCDMCVIVSAKATWNENVEPFLMDKEVLLCTLNIKAMSFSNDVDESLQAQIQAFQGSSKTKTLLSKITVPLLTELFIDKNIQFLDQDDNDTVDQEIYTCQPYACGNAFTAGVLDSLLSTVFYNVNAMTLIRTLITGGATPEMEALMAEGLSMEGTKVSKEINANRDRCRVQQISLVDPRLCAYSQSTFGELFIGSLNDFGILCLGIYRYRDSYDSSLDEPSHKRIVITSPESDFHLLGSDLVFCLTPFGSHKITNF